MLIEKEQKLKELSEHWYEIYDKFKKDTIMTISSSMEISKKDLREGDLVFFSSQKKKSKINHVGIYLKRDKFVHAGSKGVVIDSLGAAYYQRHYVASGRVKRWLFGAWCVKKTN